MPKILDAMPSPKAVDPEVAKELSIPQLRVLRILEASRGPINRARISAKCGNATHVVVGRAVGYSDPAKRASFEQTPDGGFRPSLLTLGYVEEIPLDIDGVTEIVLSLTKRGREALERTREIQLPPLRS